jgi:hypothetical protein
MKKNDQDAMRYALNHDLAAISFGMVKSKKYSEKALQDIFAYVAADKVNFGKANGFEMNQNDLSFILECTIDFIKNLAGGRIDEHLKSTVTTQFYALIKLPASQIETYKNSVFNDVKPYIK